MRELPKITDIDRRTVTRNKRKVVAILAVICLLAAPVAAQTVTQSDDFEDGNIDGWDGQNIQLSNQSIEEQYSLQASDNADSFGDFPSWQSGPTLDVNQKFNVTGTSKIDQGDGSARSGVGLIEGDSSEGMLLLFSGEFGVTFLATDGLEDYTGSQDSINTAYDNTWVNWEIRSTGNGTVQAKVWEVNTTKPSAYQLERQFNVSSGTFRVWTGTTENQREVYLDSVTLQGDEVNFTSSDNLRIDTGNHLLYGESQDYTIYSLEGPNDIRKDVTDSATVTSLNTSVLTVDQSANTITATSNENVSDRARIKVEYGGETAYKEVAVATVEVANIDVLPTWLRLSAVLLDRTLQMITAGGLISIVATRFSSAFGGIAAYQMSITAGWIIGWVDIGIAFLSLFVCLFVGLNLAANIDYTVRR